MRWRLSLFANRNRGNQEWTLILPGLKMTGKQSGEMWMNKIAVYLPDALMDNIQSIAKEGCQPVSVFIRSIIVDFVRNHDNGNTNIQSPEQQQWIVGSARLKKEASREHWHCVFAAHLRLLSFPKYL
jgi:hypothetical protein